MDTVQTVLLVVSVAVLLAAAVLRIVAPLTATKRDDEVLVVVEKVEPQAQAVVDKHEADKASGMADVTVTVKKG